MQGRIIKHDQIDRFVMPEIGKIKVGQLNDKGNPESLDYFIASGKYAHLFHDVYGPKPNSIEIVFLSDSLVDSCFERYELRKGKKLFGKGDGQIFEIWSEKDQKHVTVSIDDYPDVMERAEAKAGNTWKSILTLRFFIPSVARVLGVWTFSTRGEKSSILQIKGPFDQVQKMAGSVARVIFDLEVEKVTSQSPGSKAKFPVVKLIPKIPEAKADQFVQALTGGPLLIEGGDND